MSNPMKGDHVETRSRGHTTVPFKAFVTMQLFIYEWKFIEINNRTYYVGFGIDDNDNTAAYIDYTFCKPLYVHAYKLKDELGVDKFIRENNVGYCVQTDGLCTPLRTLYNKPQVFTQFMVQSYDGYKKLAQFFKDNMIRCYETEIDPITHFLNMNDINQTGWIEFDEFHKKNSELTFVDEYYAPINSVRRVNKNVMPNFKILSMDLETYSPRENTVPLPHNNEDEIRMIGTCIYYKGQYTKVAFTKRPTDFNVSKEDYEIRFYDDQISMIDAYIDYVRENKIQVIIGFNHLSYDYSFLASKYFNTMYNRKSYSLFRNHLMTVGNIIWSSSGYKNNELWMINSPGVVDIDVMQVCMKEQGFSGYSLNEISHTVLNDSKVDLDYGKMHTMFKEDVLEDIVLIAEYCLYDCVLPIKILLKKHMLIGTMERASVERLPANDVYTKGAGLHMIGQLHYECYTTIISDVNKNTCIPDVIVDKDYGDSISYKGATVLDPIVGLYEHCATVDFSSLYPSIIIADNICYSTYTPVDKLNTRYTYNVIKVNVPYDYAISNYCNNIIEHDESNNTATLEVYFRNDIVGIIPGLLKKLINKRNESKSMMKSCAEDEKPIWDKRQYSYKIAANSIYGLLGGSDPNLKFPLAAACVTSQGRMYLNNTVKMLNDLNSVRVIYGDTDSCFIKIDGVDSAEKYKAICSKLCKSISEAYNNDIRLEYENAFRSLLIISKKTYAGLRYDDSTYYRGVVSVRKNSSKALKSITNELLNMILRGRSVADIIEHTKNTLMYIDKGFIDPSMLKIGATINEGSSSPQFHALVKHMDEHGIIRQPRQLVYYLYIHDNNIHGSHTSSRREYSWVMNNNIPIDYSLHIKHELLNPIMKLIDLLDDNITVSDIYL